ncbi:MAG: hypothetical protein DI535_06045 [Citrobacter freundii]|nr:MAG: hypothetical protein DI535_06045 [Citrobacter freundii]
MNMIFSGKPFLQFMYVFTQFIRGDVKKPYLPKRYLCILKRTVRLFRQLILPFRQQTAHVNRQIRTFNQTKSL